MKNSLSCSTWHDDPDVMMKWNVILPLYTQFFSWEPDTWGHNLTPGTDPRRPQYGPLGPYGVLSNSGILICVELISQGKEHLCEVNPLLRVVNNYVESFKKLFPSVEKMGSMGLWASNQYLPCERSKVSQTHAKTDDKYHEGRLPIAMVYSTWSLRNVHARVRGGESNLGRGSDMVI